jgi:hypothetical protein
MRGKRRSNHVFATFGFEYPDYLNLAKNDEARIKRKHKVNILEKEVE